MPSAAAATAPSIAASTPSPTACSRVHADNRPDSGVGSADCTVDPSRGLWARVFSPRAAPSPRPPLPLVVYFHSGGFAVFSAGQCYFDPFCRRLCRGVGAVVVSVQYRLAPEYPYPAAADDATGTLLFIDANGFPGLDDGVPVDLDLQLLPRRGERWWHHNPERGQPLGCSHAPPRLQLRACASPASCPCCGKYRTLILPFFGGEERTESELRLDGVAPIVNLRRSDFWWKAFLPAGATRDQSAAHMTDVEEELHADIDGQLLSHLVGQALRGCLVLLIVVLGHPN
ncbi:hypothetical protein QYE76_000446 [Lolium multiflorum]|uniref:Alpha/beta hydrolase fold-3 domain-containing protein n=1 Tax=Lolium multiflorum TaxID=4521 RepID=A0AAD8VYR8_LOLMU|nr:hypothetical protein QYE76_000446 [Lolium multiflorum]